MPQTEFKIELNPGDKLQNGRYTIERIIGQGGFGVTYYAKHNHLDQYFAIKEFFISGFCSRDLNHNTVMVQTDKGDLYDKYKQRFIEEAQTIAKLNHPHIVKAVDVFEENNTAYFVMPFIQGKTLQQLVETNGKMSAELAVNYIAQIAEALGYIHARNLLHRDIKPDNVIITPENSVILIDFGSARTFVEDKTQSHTSILTKGYAPLEQYSGTSRKGSYSDIYSLGAVFYFLVTGQKPLDATERVLETMQVPKSLELSLPMEINRTIMKAMALKTEERHQSIQEFMDDLLNNKKTSSNEHTKQVDQHKVNNDNNLPIDKTPILDNRTKAASNTNGNIEEVFKYSGFTKFVLWLLLMIPIVAEISSIICLYDYWEPFNGSYIGELCYILLSGYVWYYNQVWWAFIVIPIIVFIPLYALYQQRKWGYWTLLLIMTINILLDSIFAYSCIWAIQLPVLLILTLVLFIKRKGISVWSKLQ